MEHKDPNTCKYIVKNTRKYIVVDTDISFSLDFDGGWPDEVVILEVKGLEKALGATCLFFDTGHNLSISDIYKTIGEQHLDYIEDGKYHGYYEEV